MAERFTILCEHPRGILDRAEREAGNRTLKDLQIDRAFRLICSDSMYRESFLSVLRTPLFDDVSLPVNPQLIVELCSK